jgi:hypothetical protein
MACIATGDSVGHGRGSSRSRRPQRIEIPVFLRLFGRSLRAGGIGSRAEVMRGSRLTLRRDDMPTAEVDCGS